MTSGGIPVPEPDFITYAVASFRMWEATGEATGDRDHALVRHVLKELGEWGWAGEVIENIDRKRAGT